MPPYRNLTEVEQRACDEAMGEHHDFDPDFFIGFRLGWIAALEWVKVPVEVRETYDKAE